MLLIVGTFRLPPARLPQARPAMQAMIAASRAEPGCREYAYAEDILIPGLIRVTEAWDSQADLDRHLSSAHLAAWRSTWPALGITERALRLYEAGDPRAT
jgi:quinol monooxygenase YgiN